MTDLTETSLEEAINEIKAMRKKRGGAWPPAPTSMKYTGPVEDYEEAKRIVKAANDRHLAGRKP